MTFNIADFNENMARFGKASTNKFEILIAIPPAIIAMINNGKINIPVINKTIDTSVNLMTFRADAAEVPGVSLMTVDNNKLGVGPRIQQPYNAVFSDCNIQFINDDQGLLEGFFNIWFNLMFNFGEDNDRTTAPTYFTNYRTDICSSAINILKYDDTGELINNYTLINALPKSISPMRFAWEQRNSLSKFTVKFEYTNFAIS